MLKWLFGRRFTLWDTVWFGIAFHTWQTQGIGYGFTIWILAIVIGCGGEFLLGNFTRP